MIPRACNEDLLIHHVDDEVVVYDTKRNLAHWLNRTATKVWGLIDGKRSIVDIAAALDIDESIVVLSVDGLANARLLHAGPALSVWRRAAVRKMAAASAIGFALPGITSIVAPTPTPEELVHHSQHPQPQRGWGRRKASGATNRLRRRFLAFSRK